MSSTSEDPPVGKRDGARTATQERATLPDAGVFPFGSTSFRPLAQRPEAAPDRMPATVARNQIFAALVTAETDVVGLVAYGLYKQNKRDWFVAFEKQHDRPPTEADVGSYTVGESTGRRLSTYRHLAEEMLAREAPAPRTRLPVPVSTPYAPSEASVSGPFAQRRFGPYARQGSDRRRGSLPALIAYLAFLVLLVVGMAWLLRSGVLPLGLGRW